MEVQWNSSLACSVIKLLRKVSLTRSELEFYSGQVIKLSLIINYK